MIRWIALILTASATSAVADAAFLGMPLECVLGDTCVIQTYPDVDASEGISDYRCGPKSTDGHSGTDFALTSYDQMAKGVRVVAAADGRVQATRNMLPDQPYVAGTNLNGQECGNAVRIDHANGYQSVYCHMKLGSVLVSPGQRVLAGQVLGEVGLSGRTTYPHLHLTITQGRDVVDPFAPDQNNACREPSETLWTDKPRYTEAGLYGAGLSHRVPNLEDLQSDPVQRSVFERTEDLFLYGHAFHLHSGDKITLVVSGPEGEVFAHTARFEKDEDEGLRAYGRRAPESGWPTGTYRGVVTLFRGATLLAVRHSELTIE